MKALLRAEFLFFAVSSASIPAEAQTIAPPIHWVGSWAASQQLPEPQNALAPDELRDTTLRQIVHLSIGGTQVRVHLSNAFGTAPLQLNSVHIAIPLSSATARIDGSTDKALTFNGRPDVLIPSGADYISDPLPFQAAPLSDLALTIYLDTPPARETGHPGSRSASYYVHGNMVASADLPNAKTVEHWYYISEVDVAAPPQAGAIVALGDSITDGHGATVNANNRWPDELARRLQAAPSTRKLSVLNQGIGGNRVLLDGLGPNAMARFDRDVLAPAGVRFLIVLEGVNDLGTLTRETDVPASQHNALVDRILAAYAQMIERAHAHGIKVIGATITPYAGSNYYHPGPASEADRQAINAWIRAAGHFDAVADFDKVVRDRNQPDRLLSAYDSGDHLHPSAAGYRAMGDAVPPSLFTF